MKQLVTMTVKHENPELEQRKLQLMEQEEKLKLQLANLEDKLLQVLGDSQGNILENQVSSFLFLLIAIFSLFVFFQHRYHTFSKKKRRNFSFSRILESVKIDFDCVNLSINRIFSAL